VTIPILDVAVAFFIGMGPVKIVAAYLAVVHSARPEMRRQVAIRTVAAATVTALLLVGLGVGLVRLLHLSNESLVIAGAIVMLAVGLVTVLEPDPSEHLEHPRTDEELLRSAIHPLAIPMLLNPAGIAAAILLSVEVAAHPFTGGLILTAVVVLGIAALDLAVLLTLAAAPRPRAEAVIILERVFGMLLVAVAVQLLIFGLASIGIVDPSLAPH
jgi:multiple antibiotic resistance protein